MSMAVYVKGRNGKLTPLSLSPKERAEVRSFQEYFMARYERRWLGDWKNWKTRAVRHGTAEKV